MGNSWSLDNIRNNQRDSRTMQLAIETGTQTDLTTANTVERLAVNTYARGAKLRKKAGVKKLNDIGARGRGFHFCDTSEIPSTLLGVFGDKLCTITEQGFTEYQNTEGDTPAITGTEPVRFITTIQNVCFVAGGQYFVFNPSRGLKVVDQYQNLQQGANAAPGNKFGFIESIAYRNNRVHLISFDPIVNDVIEFHSQTNDDEKFSSTAFEVDDSGPDRTVDIASDGEELMFLNSDAITFWTYTLQSNPFLYQYTRLEGRQINLGPIARDTWSKNDRIMFVLSNTAETKEIDIFAVQGQSYQGIAPDVIKRALKAEGLDKLKKARLELYEQDSIEFLLVHLTNQTFQLNITNSEWIELTGIEDGPRNRKTNHRFQFYTRDLRNNRIIVADKYTNSYGVSDEQLGNEYGKPIKQLLYTGQFNDLKIIRMALVGNFGGYKQNQIPSLVLSISNDNINYANNAMFKRFPKNYQYDQKSFSFQVGDYFKGFISFQLEITSSTRFELEKTILLNESAKGL
ncbi:hypothetical protein [uncultured Mediterranean phage uvMED]|nr:hypothetical protein [uncultured Mediterranean phage uvMED]